VLLPPYNFVPPTPPPIAKRFPNLLALPILAARFTLVPEVGTTAPPPPIVTVVDPDGR
jgi:hypothetical protein